MIYGFSSIFPGYGGTVTDSVPWFYADERRARLCPEPHKRNPVEIHSQQLPSGFDTIFAEVLERFGKKSASWSNRCSVISMDLRALRAFFHRRQVQIIEKQRREGFVFRKFDKITDGNLKGGMCAEREIHLLISQVFDDMEDA